MALTSLHSRNYDAREKEMELIEISAEVKGYLI